MFKFIKRIMGLSGEYRKKLNRAYVLSFFESLASNVPICILLYVLMTIINGSFGKNTIIIAFAGIFAGVILRMIFRYLTDINQSGVGYEIFARERMTFSDRIKRFPMGFFSEGNIGNVTSVITNDISFVEEHGMDTLGKITTSVIGIGISFVFLLALNVWVALAMAITTALFFAAFAAAHRVASEEAVNQQEAQNKLVGTVIEYIKGMPVVKAFNLAGKSHKATSEDFWKLTEAQIKFEKRFSTPIIVSQCMTGLCISAVIFICGYVGLDGGMELPFVIAMSVFAFELAAPMLALINITAFRVADASLDRYDRVRQTEMMDDSGKPVRLNNFDIDFKNVTFGYNESAVIKNMSFHIPQHSMTALVREKRLWKKHRCKPDCPLLGYRFGYGKHWRNGYQSNDYGKPS